MGYRSNGTQTIRGSKCRLVYIPFEYIKFEISKVKMSILLFFSSFYTISPWNFVWIQWFSIFLRTETPLDRKVRCKLIIQILIFENTAVDLSHSKVYEKIQMFFFPNKNLNHRLFWIRVWWITFFILSVISCFIAILSIWTKWTNGPVVVTFDDKTTPIGMIPFPAVSICSSQKFSEHYFEKLISARSAGNLTNLSVEE